MVIQHVLAISRCIEQPENGKQRGFTATGRPSDGDVFTFINVEVNAGESVCFYLVGVENFLDVGKMDKGLGVRLCRIPVVTGFLVLTWYGSCLVEIVLRF
jgi:hypothetical protein